MAITFGSGVQLGAGVNAAPAAILMLSLDAGNLTSYPGSGNIWTDTIGGLQFTLYNSPSYDPANGGYLAFDTASTQYAESATSLSDLNTWSVETWHYYTGTNSGTLPCIVTETFPGSTGKINYSLGDLTAAGLDVGWYNGGGWEYTTTEYSLTAGTWYHIVGTYDGNSVKLYINNTLVAYQAVTGSAMSSQGGIRLMRRWDDNDYWGGRLAVVNIYKGDLKQSHVTANWNASKTRFGYGLTTTFTINPGDISNPVNLYGGYNNSSSAGFTALGTVDLENGINYTITQSLYDSILAAQTNAGFDPNWAGTWNVSWNTGGNGLVRLGLVDNVTDKNIVIAPIDQTDTRWQSGGFFGPTQAGTFTFPAVFTPRTPNVQNHGNSQWC
jgi:hypothetical protein